MTDSLDDMTRRIAAATKVGSVVHIMKVISATQIRRCELAAEASRAYEAVIAQAFGPLFRSGGFSASAPVGPDAMTVIIVLGTDQGLVGTFNDQLVDYALPLLRGYAHRKVFSVGRRLADRLKDHGIGVEKTYGVPRSTGSISSAVLDVLTDIEKIFTEDQEASCVVMYNRPESRQGYQPTTTRIIPLDEKWVAHMGTSSWPTRQIPQVVGPPQVSLTRLLREHLLVALCRAFAESLSSEHTSRFQAMQRAEKNIDEVHADISQRINLFRQTAVDAELFDVISGFSALSNEVGI